MKIATKTGDDGNTGLLYGKRTSKFDDRIELVGNIDELSASIGLIKPELSLELAKNSLFIEVEHIAKAYAFKDGLARIQETLIKTMGEVSCETNDRPRYYDQFPKLDYIDLHLIDNDITFLENLPILDQKHWVLYGKNRVGAAYHFASKICRRTERALIRSNIYYSRAYRSVLLQYFNRLSDYLYLVGRFFEEILPKQY